MLERARQDAMLSIGSLWLRYFELGGMGTALELEAYLCGALVPRPHEYDVLVHPQRTLLRDRRESPHPVLRRRGALTVPVFRADGSVVPSRRSQFSVT